MNNNKERFIQDILDTFDHTTAYKSAILLCALFGFVGLFFSITMMESVLPYISIYTTYLAFFGLSVFCIIGGIGCVYALLKQYMMNLHSKDTQECIRYLPITFASMIPGFIMLMYCALVENSEFEMAISYISFYLCIYALLVIGVSYAMVKTRLEKENIVYQKKTLRYVEWSVIIVFMFAFFATLILGGSGFEDIPKIFLITFIVTVLSYQCGRCAVAKSFYDQMNVEFMDYQKLYHDGTLGRGDNSLKARVTIINDGRFDKALDILEEFGFDREQCTTAILKHIPFYTFDEKMYYDIIFMRKLLMRLSYEDVPFRVEEWSGKEWIYTSQYEDIEKRRFMRREKVEKQSEKAGTDEKNGIIFNILATVIAGIIMIIYGIWAALIPVNHFRPVRWSSFEQIQENYKDLTYPNGRMIYHMICIWIIFILFICIQPLQNWFCQIVNAQIDTVAIVFGILFISELFIFPLYLKRLKMTVNKNSTLHNYEKRAFVAFVIYTMIRNFIRGWQKSLCMLLLLIVAIELAKSLFVTIRYIIYRKESLAIKNNKSYEIIEVYDDNHPQKEIVIIDDINEDSQDLKTMIERINQYKQPVIQLNYSDEQPTRYSSQLGGIPYLLKGQKIPGDEDGPFILLAQINFDEIKDHSIPDYPQQGILQFFIKSDDVYGCDFDSEYDHKKFSVIYHEEVDYNPEHLQDIDLIDTNDTPINSECRLVLSVVEESGLASTDFQFGDKLEELCPSLLSDYKEYFEKIEDYYMDMAEYNKLGGQGYFLQEDSRSDPSSYILLQLVSDVVHMMWGDYGTCHFFIERDDLINKNFDNVMYEWECY